jgi:hypothetical protein
VDRDLQAIARRFLEFVHRATRLPMIVCDEAGTIVEAVDRSRIGTTHAFAKRILGGEADELFVTKDDVARDPRMKEGCNRVIRVDGRGVGTFGLAGPLEVAQPLARVAVEVMTSWVQEERQQRTLRAAADQVLEGVRGVAARADGAAAEAAAVVEQMAAASRDASEKVAHTDEVLRTVQEIARKSRILSINGSVEAARAGDQGAAFGVVAREMLELAEHARRASADIQVKLGQVQRAIGTLREAIERSSSLTRGQVTAFAEVRGVVQSLERAVMDLTAVGSGAEKGEPAAAARPAPASGAARRAAPGSPRPAAGARVEAGPARRQLR